MATIDELISTLSAEPGAVRRVRGPWQLCGMWLALSLAYVAVLVAVFGIRPDIAARLMAPMYMAELGMLVLIIASTALSVLVLSYPDMRQSPGLVCMPLVPLAGFVALLLASLWGQVPPAPLPPHGMECLICISLFSLVPAMGLMAYLRTQASTHYFTSGAVALVNAFSIGCLALRMVEPTDSALHLIQWHYLPMIASAIIGLAAGRIVLKW